MGAQLMENPLVLFCWFQGVKMGFYEFPKLKLQSGRCFSCSLMFLLDLNEMH